MKKKFLAIVGTLMLLAALVPMTVGATAETATRDLPDSVLVNTDFDVTITLETTFGNVVETLPTGFTYASCAAGTNMPAGGVTGTAVGQEVTFTFFASATPATFTYKVTAPSSAVTGATFSGTLKPGPDPATWTDVGGDLTMDVVSEGWDPWAYDENEDGKIQKSEAIQAVQDYFSGKIAKEQAIGVVTLYFG